MVVGGPAFTDAVPKNGLVIPAGGFGFIQIALKESASGSLSPLDADWASQDPLFTTLDADGSPIDWGTNELDASDPDDDFDENRSTYVGDLFSPAIPGLHAQLDAGTNTPLRLLLKVKAPSGTEQTSSNTNRNYSITWNLRKNGAVVPDVQEDFNVGPAGIPVFADISITWAEVTAVVSSSITSATQQEVILLEASEYARGLLEEYAINPDALPTTATRTLKFLMLQYARLLVQQYDASIGAMVTEIREGHDTIKFAGRSSADLSKAFDLLHDRFMSWIAMVKAGSFFTYGSFTQNEAVQ